MRTSIVTAALTAAVAAGPAQAELLIRHAGPHTGGHPHSNGRATAMLRHDRATAAKVNHAPGQGGGHHGAPFLP